jgi:hypothetical protein
MLRFARLHFFDPREVGDRKLRLFAAACCRLITRALDDPRSRRVIEVVEGVAEGLFRSEELEIARRDAAAASSAAHSERGKVGGGPAWVAVSAADPNPIYAAIRVVNGMDHALLVMEAPRGTLWTPDPGEQMTVLRNLSGDAALMERVATARGVIPKRVRDIFGNPFRPFTLDPSSLAWNGGAVRKIAQAIYDGRRFADLPVLADALEDAGCADAAILGHCRGGGEHVRGCWVVDLLLGKS